MRNSRAVLLIFCLLASGALLACGDDESGSDGSPTEEFIAEADEVCQAAAEDAIANALPTPTTAEEAVPVLKDTQKRREQLTADLEALGDPPSDIAEQWEQVLDTYRQRANFSGELAALAEEGVPATAPRYTDALAASSELEDEKNKIMKGLGSTACAEVLSPGEREEIIAMVIEFETKALEDCTEFMTDEAVELLFGSLEECQRIQENPPPEGFTKKVEVTHIEGIDEVSASVDASLSGGIGDGQEVTYSVVYVDGRYKIDAVTIQT